MTRNLGRSKIVVGALLALVLLFVFSGCSRTPTGAIRLGALFPLTGDVASYGQAAKAGIELAVEEVNASGGINGRKIEVDIQDDKGEAKTAVGIMKQFTSVQKYPVIFGSAGSSVTLALTPIADREKVLLVSPIASSTKLSTEGGKFFFRTV